jgi:uncharacterized protein (TIRG00374 family)
VIKHLRSIIGIALSVGLLWWVLRDVSPSVVLHELGQANPWLLIIGMICSTLIFPIRARKWRTILDPIHPKLPFGPLWRSTAIGMALNNLIPARAGEVARAYTITRETSVNFSTSIASLAVDRVFDAIVLLLLALASVLDPRFPSGVRIENQSIESWVIGSSLLVVILLVALYTLVFFPKQLIRLFELFARRLSPAIEEKGRQALLTFSSGLSVMRSPGHFVAIFGWTCFYWLLNALGWWIAMKAVGITVPYSAAVLLQSLVALGVAIPAAPGFFGVFEKIAVVGLAIYAVPKELATSWAIGFHIISFLPITVIGAIYFSRMDLSLRDLEAKSEAAAQGRTLENDTDGVTPSAVQPRS